MTILERETLEIVDSFGQWGSAPGDFGTLHHMDVDSRGNLYVTEVTPLDAVNRRIQKFTFTGMGRPGWPAADQLAPAIEPTLILGAAGAILLSDAWERSRQVLRGPLSM